VKLILTVIGLISLIPLFALLSGFVVLWTIVNVFGFGTFSWLNAFMLGVSLMILLGIKIKR
jgi:hypothetical protein